MNKEGSSKQGIAIIHYSALPVIGGVENVIASHGKLFASHNYPVTIIAGRGEVEAMPPGIDFYSIPLADSKHPDILAINRQLEMNIVPADFNDMKELIKSQLDFALSGFDVVMVHNVFTRHHNLPLTAALTELMEEYQDKKWIAWCHDFSWCSESSRSKLHDGYPWDLLRSRISHSSYVTISLARARQLAALYKCEQNEISVIENGVSPDVLLGLSQESLKLVEKYELLEQDVNIIMPIRITQAKNIEYALEVTAALKNEGLKVRLVITGPPDPHSNQGMMYYNWLRKLRHSLGIEHEACFVFETGNNETAPYTIDMRVVSDLYRACDILLLPSHREGFGMSVLEAGLLGMPVYTSTHVPAAVEIAASEISIIEEQQPSYILAKDIIQTCDSNPQLKLKRRIRQNYTWEAIFKKKIEPLLYA